MANKYENLLLLGTTACCTSVLSKKEYINLDFRCTPLSPTGIARATISI